MYKKIKIFSVPLLILSMLITLLFAGCTGSTATSETSAPTETAAPTTETVTEAETSAAEESEEKNFEGVTITLQTFLNPQGESPREKALGEVIADFKAKTGITVEALVLPWNENDPQLMLSVQSGNPPDASWVLDRAFLQHIEADSLIPLDNYISEDFDEATKADYLLWDKMCVSDGKKYAISYSIIPTSLFIRKDLLAEAGLEAPKTWDEFVEVGKALKSSEIIPYLFNGSLKEYNQLDWIQSMVEGRGGKIIDENGMASFNSQEGIETYEFLKSLVYDSKIVPESAKTTSFDEVSDTFAAGKVGMIIEGSHRYTRDIASLGAEKVEVVRIPGVEADKPSPARISSWTVGIPKGSKNPDAAWEFIKYFTSAEAQLKYSMISGEVPVRQSVTEDAFYSSEGGMLIKWWVQYIADASSIAAPSTKYNELGEIIGLALQETLDTPDSNVKEILDTAVKKYNDLFE